MDIESEIYRVIYVNTHPDDRVITDADFYEIGGLEDVFAINRVGNYAMELVVVVHEEDVEKTEQAIREILNQSTL